MYKRDETKFGRMKSLKIQTFDESEIELNFQDLDLVIDNNILCWYSSEYNLYMPIKRLIPSDDIGAAGIFKRIRKDKLFVLDMK